MSWVVRVCALLALPTTVAFAQEAILGAIYGYDNCIAVASDTDFEALSNQGCAVVTSPGGAQHTNAVASQRLRAICGGTVRGLNYDGIPVVFSSPVNASGMMPDDFSITLSTGAVIHPDCATPFPANENNEFTAMLLIGSFGDGLPGTLYSVHVNVTGALTSTTGASLQGLHFDLRSTGTHNYTTSALRMVSATVTEFSAAGETTTNLAVEVYPNHCAAVYPAATVTHRVRVELNGGGTVDGVRSLIPGKASDRTVFRLLTANGSELQDDYVVGLADLGIRVDDPETVDEYSYDGDGDHYFDVCLGNGISDAEAQTITHVRMPCTPATRGALVPPKGFPACSDHTIETTQLVSTPPPTLPPSVPPSPSSAFGTLSIKLYTLLVLSLWFTV